MRYWPEKRLIAYPVARLTMKPAIVIGTKYSAVCIGSSSLTCWKLQHSPYDSQKSTRSNKGSEY